MWFLEVSQESSIMLDLIRTVLLDLCNIVYKLIIVLYELFMAVGDATILNSSSVQTIYNRIGLILGIIMMFRLIFSFVQYLLDPDKITDKETGVGGLIKKIIIVILALGLTNWAFEKAFEIQSDILSENVIGKIVLGVNSSDNVDMEAYGTMFSYTLFQNFFYLNPELDTTDDSELKGCGKTFFETTFRNYVGTYKDLDYAHECVNEHGLKHSNHAISGNKVYYAVFNGLEALVIGGFVLWVLLMYTITLAVRVVKLAFLRIVAPVPILSYLAPKKSNAFSNWLKQCLTTYLDLFIRIAIIYFAMLLISVIFNQGVLLGSSTLPSTSGLDKWFKIILVLGVLLFAKKMPEILGEIFPGMSGKGGLDFGFGLKSRTDFAGKGLVTRTVGAAAGAVGIGAVGALQGSRRKMLNKNGDLVTATGGRRALNTFTGAISGVGRGLRYGAHGGKIRDNIGKAFHNQVAASASVNEYVAAGGDSLGARMRASVARELGLPTAYDELKAEQQNLENRRKKNEDNLGRLKSAGDSLDSVTNRLSSKITDDDAKTKFGASTPREVLDYLEKKGIIAREDINNPNSAYRLIRYKNRDGSVKRNADGSLHADSSGVKIDGRRYAELDNVIENYKNEAKQRVDYLNEEKNKRQQRLSIMEANGQGNSVAANSLKASIEGINTQLDVAYDNLNSINVTESVKRLKEAATIHLVVGGTDANTKYDDDVARNDLTTFITHSSNNVDNMNTYLGTIANSTNAKDAQKHADYSRGVNVLNTMMDVLNEIRKPGVTSDDINNQLARLQGSDFQHAIDFDVVNQDGSFGEKEIKIDNVFDLLDNLANYQKAISRSFERENIELATRIAEIEQSARMVRERLADEHRIGGKGS